MRLWIELALPVSLVFVASLLVNSGRLIAGYDTLRLRGLLDGALRESRELLTHELRSAYPVVEKPASGKQATLEVPTIGGPISAPSKSALFAEPTVTLVSLKKLSLGSPPGNATTFFGRLRAPMQSSFCRTRVRISGLRGCWKN